MRMPYIRSTHRTSMIQLLAAATMLTWLTSVAGHGRLMDPPARNSMWRLGFANPVNYNDNELYCGGRVTQWARNKGKCGVCGDPYHNTIKDHEVGGKYANGIISREYTQGGTIEIIVHITANHKGYFEFRICPVEDPKVEVTQECLDTHLMTMANGVGSRYSLPEGKSNQFFNVSVQLPEDVTCKQCVVQWKYRTGNTWDKDESGKFCVGCGPQEEFYNCADVTVHPRGHPVEVQQTGNSQTLIQNGRKKSSHDVDRSLKEEDKSFSGTKDNLKTAASNTISEYGKQKVHFIKKLEGNKYSQWGEPKSTEIKHNNGSPFAHLARKNSKGSRKEISNNLKFGYLGDGYLNHSPVAKALPDQVSGSAWKAGVSDSTQIDGIRRRFGFSVSSTRENRNNSSVGIQGQTTHNVDGSSNNLIATSADNRTNDNIYYRATTSHGPRITETSIHSRRADVTAIHGNNSKFHRKDVSHIDNSQSDVIQDSRTTPKERDNFLQKWKLEKLGRIAAHRALQSKHIPGNKKSSYWYTTATKNPVTQPMLTMKPAQTANSTTPVILSTRQSQKSHEFVKQRMGSNIHTSVVDAYTTSPKPQIDSKHRSVRKQLPAWLVTALRLKESETDNGYKNGRVNRNQNFNKEIRKLAVKGNERKELLKSFLRPQLTDVSQGYADLSSTKLNPDTNQNRQFAHTSLADLSKVQRGDLRKDVDKVHRGDVRKDVDKVHRGDVRKDVDKVHRGYIRKDVDRPSEDEPSDLSYKDIQDGDDTETESLVRYIVSLLISQMKDNDSKEHNGKLGAQIKSMLGDILLSTVAPGNAIVKDTTSGGDTWFLRGPISASTNKHYPSSNAVTDHQKKSEATRTISNTGSDQHYHYQRKEDDLPPSVRGEVRAFNGLVLGSDYGSNQRLSRNQVEKYHNWRTAGLSDKHDDVNAKGISKQVILSGNKNIIADNGNNVHQKIYSSRPEYKDMRNDKQPAELWLQSEVQETPIDHHQLWSIRAGRRRDHYNRQHDIARSELICESLVVLSGGMNRWCTDNCNANFCPSSLCVCTLKSPAGSLPLMETPLAIPRKHTWTQPKQHSGALLRQHSRATADEDVAQGFYTPTDMNPRSDRYITATRSTITKFPQHPTRDNQRSHDKIHVHSINTHAPAMQLLHSHSHETNKDKMSLFLEKLLGQNTNFPQSRAEKIDSFKSTKTEPNYLFRSISAQEHQKIPHAFNDVQQKGANKQFDNYHMNDNYAQSPQTAPNDINSRFQTLPQIPEVPQMLNWYTQTNRYNLRKTSHPALEKDIHGYRARVSLQPYKSHGHSISHGVLTHKAVSNSGVYNIRETTGPIDYNLKSIYSHTPPVESAVSTREGRSRLTCKAIGAFAGVKHFEEWCLSTCLTTMCPLTVCSCEQQSTHDLLHGR